MSLGLVEETVVPRPLKAADEILLYSEGITYLIRQNLNTNYRKSGSEFDQKPNAF